MRRISQLCGMELKQDVLVVKDDALKKQVFAPGPSVNSSPGDTPLIGDATAASKKKKKKTKKGNLDPPWPRGRIGILPIKLTLVRVIATAVMVAEVSSICSRSARESSSRLPEKRPLRWKTPVKMVRLMREVGFTPPPLV